MNGVMINYDAATSRINAVQHNDGSKEYSDETGANITWAPDGAKYCMDDNGASLCIEADKSCECSDGNGNSIVIAPNGTSYINDA